MPLETMPWDSADYLKTKEDVASYLEAAFEDGDFDLIMSVFGSITHSEALAEVADAMGLSAAALKEALTGEGNPKLSTMFEFLKALKLCFVVGPAPSSEAA